MEPFQAVLTGLTKPTDHAMQALLTIRKDGQLRRPAIASRKVQDGLYFLLPLIQVSYGGEGFTAALRLSRCGASEFQTDVYYAPWRRGSHERAVNSYDHFQRWLG